jgi:VanZ family protein
MLIVSSLPGNRLPAVGFWQWDKLAHFSEYFVLAILLLRYCVIRWNMKRPKVFFWCAGIIAVYAGLDELHQLMIPFRACTWQDYVADNAGAIAGLGLMINRPWQKAKK